VTKKIECDKKVQKLNSLFLSFDVNESGGYSCSYKYFSCNVNSVITAYSRSPSVSDNFANDFESLFIKFSKIFVYCLRIFQRQII